MQKARDIDSGAEAEFSFLDDWSAVIAATEASQRCAKLFASDHRAGAAKASRFSKLPSPTGRTNLATMTNHVPWLARRPIAATQHIALSALANSRRSA